MSQRNLCVLEARCLISQVLYTSDEVSEAVLNEHFSFMAVGTAAFGQLEETLFAYECYLEYHWNPIKVIRPHKRKLFGNINLLTGTCIPYQVGDLPLNKPVNLAPLH